MSLISAGSISLDSTFKAIDLFISVEELLVFAFVVPFCLKVPKCEIFHLFDFNDFYGIKSP